MESRVEQFEQIRRDRDREGLSIRGLAVRHGVHRRAVRQALASPVPPAKRSPVGRPAPRLGPYRAVIDCWLEADRVAPRKQRHTAKRIHQRLVDEHGADVAETTVRQYVRGRKRAMGWPIGDVFVPQVHAPGMEAEVDWGEALVVLAGVATTVHLFGAPWMIGGDSRSRFRPEQGFWSSERRVEVACASAAGLWTARWAPCPAIVGTADACSSGQGWPRLRAGASG